MRTSVLALSLLFVVLVARPAFRALAEDDGELASELDKLGLGGDMAEGIADQISAATSGAGGNVPVPDPPTEQMHSQYGSDDDFDDDDSEPDFLNMKAQKEIYEKGGDVQRVNVDDFDDEVFNGDQEFTIVIFYTKWCKECQLHGASMRAVGRKYRDDPKVKIVAVNQEGNYDLSARFDTDPGDAAIYFAKKNPQVDNDLKYYEGEVMFASMLQFIESRGTDMVKVEKHVQDLYPEGQTKVVQLNWDNFNQTVFNPKLQVIVQFYAGWSEFCQIDAGNYTVVAYQMDQTHKDKVVIAAVDTDKHEKLSDRFDITGMPAYWYFNTSAKKDTDAMKYTGDHNGAMVVEEATDFITSDGAKIPYGMTHEHPIHPKPWEQIEREMKERKRKEAEKDAKELEQQKKDMAERKEKLAKKKAAKAKKLAEKAAANSASHGGEL